MAFADPDVSLTVWTWPHVEHRTRPGSTLTPTRGFVGMPQRRHEEASAGTRVPVKSAHRFGHALGGFRGEHERPSASAHLCGSAIQHVEHGVSKDLGLRLDPAPAADPVELLPG